MQTTSQKRAIALIMVLGVLALLSVLAITFVSITRLESQISRYYVDKTHAVLAAESGIEYALSRLLGCDQNNSAVDITDMEFKPGPNPGDLEHAVKASFQIPGVAKPMSGFVSSTYTENSEYFILKVTDLSGGINLNDTNGKWNLDDDPDPDPDPAPATDLDILNAYGRLEKIVEILGDKLFGPPMGTFISNQLYDETVPHSRPNLQGGRFSNMRQVEELLVVPGGLENSQFEEFCLHVTLNSWQDSNVIRPTFQLEISHPDRFPNSSTLAHSLPYNSGIPLVEAAELSNIYMYSDFQTKYFELEPRCPVNVNTCSQELLEALIAPVRGHFLYEGPPSGLMDGLLAPWIKAMRASSYSWDDVLRHNGYDGGGWIPWVGWWSFDFESVMTPSQKWNLGNETRYGVACITGDLDQTYGSSSGTVAEQLARQIYDRIHDSDDPKPFSTWDEFTRFIYEMVDSEVQILYDRVNIPDDLKEQLPPKVPLDISTIAIQRVIDLSGDMESNRFPYMLNNDCSYIPGAGVKIDGLSRYMADALLANFNPNSQLNDYNPDFHIFRHVDKSQLTQYTTELCFQSTGVYSIHSLGLVRGAEELRSKYSIETVIKLFHHLRFSTQEQFMQDYDQDDPQSIYEIFRESYGVYPTAGADLVMGSGDVGGNNRWGPSLTSYPEPVRVKHSLSMEERPIPDESGNNTSDTHKFSYFSKYDGCLMLSTYQRQPANYLAGQPIFLAPMGYRYLSESDQQWQRRSQGQGGLLPVLFGVNDSYDTMNDTGGRGVMLVWDKDYTMPPKKSINKPLDQPPTSGWPTGPDFAWNPDEPWKDYRCWTLLRQRYDAHMWGGLWWGLYCLDPIVEPEVGIPNSSADFIYRIGWNMPTDNPLTPDVRNTEGDPVQQVQGVLYPDGAFSEAGRLLSYRSTNLGSDFGTTGSIAFWAKPNWDAGYSNRIRQLFSMGHVGPAYTHALDLLYFPVSPGLRPELVYEKDGKVITWDPPDGPFKDPSWGWNNANCEERLNWDEPLHYGCKYNMWPFCRNSFMFGWYYNCWSQYHIQPKHRGPTLWDMGFYRGSQTATDFFPFRNKAHQIFHYTAPSDSWMGGFLHRHYGFYGHQWNLFGMSYLNTLTPGGDPGGNLDFPNGNIVSYSINGEEVVQDVWGAAYHSLYTLTKPYVDFYWERNPYYTDPWNLIDPAGNRNPEPDNIYIGKNYMRLGWCAENGGPVGDSTYDDIVTWANPVSMDFFRSMWDQGRYLSETLEGAHGQNVIGMYTSPEISLHKALQRGLAARNVQNIRLHSVNWTLYWPRYNWRPNGVIDPGDPDDYNSWGDYLMDQNGMDGINGMNVDASSDPESADPVTGHIDPLVVDVFTTKDNWVISGDDGSNNKEFDNLNQMLASAGDSRFDTKLHSFNYVRGDKFRYRLYFVLEPEQMLMESPVLDDITFVFTTGNPVVLSWNISAE
ncbi:hypothetical protein ACFL54_03625 [Planctomycetota bacterium]